MCFAAGFAVPVGLNGSISSSSSSDPQGFAALLRRGSFLLFLVSNSVAMHISIPIVCVLFWTDASTDSSVAASVLTYTTIPILCALFATSIAFVTGTYLFVSEFPWFYSANQILGLFTLYYMLNLIYYMTGSIRWPSPTTTMGRSMPRKVGFPLFFVVLIVHLTFGPLTRLYETWEDEDEDEEAEHASGIPFEAR